MRILIATVAITVAICLLVVIWMAEPGDIEIPFNAPLRDERFDPSWSMP